MRSAALVTVSMMLAGWAGAQAPPLASGTRIQAELKTTLDTQRAQVGETVTAVTTDAVKDHKTTLLPKGSVLTGHITAVVAAESPKSPAHLALLFDQATPKHGATMALRAVIAQIPDDRPSTAMDDMRMPSPQPMPAGGEGSQAGSRGSLGEQAVPPMVTAPAPSPEGRGSNGRPLEVQLPRNAQAAANGSVLSSPHGDLKVNAGTRLVLVVLPQ